MKPRPTIDSSGFTLLEILVAIALLGIALTVVFQLFSANLVAIRNSEDHVAALVQAGVKMREILDTEDFSERAWTEATPEGYRIDAAITETLKERMEGISVKLFEVNLTISWTKGDRTRSVNLRTLKVLPRQV